jgi:hypothetical protein
MKRGLRKERRGGEVRGSGLREERRGKEVRCMRRAGLPC